MAKTIQFKRGTTAQVNAYRGALGEIVVDTDKEVLVVHDGSTTGGFAGAARANTDGSVSIIARDGTILTTLNASTKLVDYTPVPYPKTAPPTGYLMLMGQAISQATYPILYSLYGANLPDLRGEFIRGWDNSRGVDSGRAVLSYQSFAIENILGNLGSSRAIAVNTQTGAFYSTASGQWAAGTGGTANGVYDLLFDASRAVNTATETRPRNIAFNYIVKAG